MAIPVETARRLSCSCKVITALTRKGESRVIHAMQLGYPRFVYHSFVEKFFADCAKKFAGAEEFAKHIRPGRLVK